jgi:hypothetical protein
MSVIPPVGETWLVTLECKQTSSFLNGVTQPLPGNPAVTLSSDPSVSGAKWAMTSVDQESVSLRCMGHLEGPRFLNGLTAERKVALAPITSGVFTGTHWFAFPDQSDPNSIELICQGTAPGGVQLAVTDGVVLTNRFFPAPPRALWTVQLLGKLSMLQCMGTAPGPAHRFLNGRTADNPPTVDLQDLTSGANTGTVWLTAFADGSGDPVTISCQGVLDGPRFLTGDGTVGLVGSPDDSSGTIWFFRKHPVDQRYLAISLDPVRGPFLNGTTFAGGPKGPGTVDLAPSPDGIFTGTMWRQSSPSIWWEPCPARPSSGPVVVRTVERLAQLTGFKDPEGVQMKDTSQDWGVWGTDLGANCKDPAGKLFIFFGDVIPFPDPNDRNRRDCHFVASIEAGTEITSITAASLTPVLLPNTNSFEAIRVNGDIGVTHTFEVASGAFWWNNKVHVFMHVNADTRKNHPEQQNMPPQGCYLVSKADPSTPGSFEFEFPFSPQMTPPPDYIKLSRWERFGGVAPVVVQNADHPWLPSRTGQGLVMFGIGFNNNVGDMATHLAWMPLIEGRDPSVDTVQYYFGNIGDRAIWLGDAQPNNQDNAVALFGAEPNLQSISAMWDQDARGWLIMHMTADINVNIVGPVIARIGETPLTMSDSFAVFDPCREAAYAKYMHWPGLDDIHSCDPPTVAEGPAWAYGAFLLDGRSKIDLIRGNVDLYYLLSLSSPYQVQLMHTSLQLRVPCPLLFYNDQTGDGKTAIADSAGGFKDFVQQPSGFGDWTHVIGTPGGGVLFYNASDGSAATAVVDSNGQYNFKSTLDDSLSPGPGWTHITSVGRYGLFFYKFDTGTGTGSGKTALLDGSGNFKPVKDIDGFGEWTHVVGCLNGTMLFYNLSGGAGGTATVDASGGYTFIGDINDDDLDAGWTQIAAVGVGSLIFYNVDTTDGAGATGTIDDSGEYTAGEHLNNLNPPAGPWTRVVGLKNGSVFFYRFGATNVDPPMGATATIDQDGHYVRLQTWSFFPIPTSPWSWITAV